MGQFIFVLVLIAFSVIDAASRKKQQRGRMDEMETEEGGDGVDTGPRSRRPGPRERREIRRDARRELDRPSEHRTVSTAPSPDSSGWAGGADPIDEHPAPYRGGEREEPAEEEERVTADSLVPEELWAILTGQPVPERPAPPRAPKPSTAAGYPGSPGTETVPQEATPTSEPTTRRSDTWMSGVEGREASERWTSGSTREVPAFDPGEASIYAEIEEPWGDLEDITAGELGDGKGHAQEGEKGSARRGRGGRSARYLAPLTEGGREGLRSAVVMQEVLGRPVAFRD